MCILTFPVWLYFGFFFYFCVSVRICYASEVILAPLKSFDILALYKFDYYYYYYNQLNIVSNIMVN